MSAEVPRVAPADVPFITIIAIRFFLLYCLFIYLSFSSEVIVFCFFPVEFFARLFCFLNRKEVKKTIEQVSPLLTIYLVLRLV